MYNSFVWGNQIQCIAVYCASLVNLLSFVYSTVCPMAIYVYICIAVDPEDDFTFSASDEEDDTQLARAIADDMG